MDRNVIRITTIDCISSVALRKESVDRNPPITVTQAKISLVALRKESVDRNCWGSKSHGCEPSSLSARRAWIEMEDDGILSTGASVALRKESVDRNYDTY